MSINGVAFPAHYRPHAEWPQTPPKKLIYGWRQGQRLCATRLTSRTTLGRTGILLVITGSDWRSPSSLPPFLKGDTGGFWHGPPYLADKSLCGLCTLCGEVCLGDFDLSKGIHVRNCSQPLGSYRSPMPGWLQGKRKAHLISSGRHRDRGPFHPGILAGTGLFVS
jgi:hypothetical protein